jgi:hypothetical protein
VTARLIDKALDASNSNRQKSILVAMRTRVEGAKLRIRSKNARLFDLPPLDIATAAKNVRDDIGGDWYQDPWGWPEIDWLGSANPKMVADRLKSGLSGWTIPMDVSKGDRGVRPGIIINPLDRVAFQSLADDLSLEAAGELPPWVHGWRLARSSRKKGAYSSNKLEWKHFSRRVFKLCTHFSFTAHLDIQAFFATVDTSRLLAQLGRRYRNMAVLDRLECYFNDWHSRQNGSGIPQRCWASSVLAHVVLRPLDDFLNQRSGGGGSNTFAASRWMDDIWLHSNNENELRVCVAEVENILAQLRLSLNAEKSEIFASNDAKKYAQLVDVYEAVEEDEPRLSLKQLVDVTPKFRIGLEVSKILATKNFSLLNGVPIDRWAEFSHLGTRLAKVFRVSGDWERFTDVYLDFVNRHVSAENLSVASWAEMFPNTPNVAVTKVHDYFSQHISGGTQRLLIPLAAQRLAAWSSQFGAGGLADINFGDPIDEPAHVFRLRGIAFAALPLEAAKNKAIAAINEANDEVISGFIKDKNFTVPLSSRFQTE